LPDREGHGFSRANNKATKHGLRTLILSDAALPAMQ